jgi:hypothetical protein
MLDDAARSGTEHIVSWLPGEGNSFRIHIPKDFASHILPKFFEKIKFRSFQRQLNIYGFRRISDRTSPDYGAYYHEFFVRNKSHLCLQMQRQRIKGTKNSSSRMSFLSILKQSQECVTSIDCSRWDLSSSEVEAPSEATSCGRTPATTGERESVVKKPSSSSFYSSLTPSPKNMLTIPIKSRLTVLSSFLDNLERKVPSNSTIRYSEAADSSHLFWEGESASFEGKPYFFTEEDFGEETG